MSSNMANSVESPRRISPGRRAISPALTAALAVFAGASVLVYGLLAPAAIHRTCFLVAETGLPCPLCGGTRAVSALAHGHVLSALQFHAVAAVFFPAILVLGVSALAVPAHREKISSWLPAFAGISGWAWLAYWLLRLTLALTGVTTWST